MKISKITLEGFRAFNEPFVLDLDGGKNLLLHGENGSGKSSIFLALKRFFEERGDDVTKHRNVFSPDGRLPSVRLELLGEFGNGPERKSFHWDVADGHPLPVPKDPATAPIPANFRSLLVEAARRSGFLDYRSLLRTHFATSPLSRTREAASHVNDIYGAKSAGLEALLFELMAFVVLASVRVTVGGGRVETIGNLARSVWQYRPPRLTKRRFQQATLAAQELSTAMNACLADLRQTTSLFLSEFEQHGLEVEFEPVSLSLTRLTKELSGASLIPIVKFRGHALQDYQHFLNEARLSALAICWFLAGVTLSNNDPETAGHPRFLVLDDALIGLELQNRLPILKILSRPEFQHYQIFLLTHDRVWFELAKGHLKNDQGWLHRELHADEDTGQLIPRLRSSDQDLSRARDHLARGDLKAAAVYARSAFEWKLRKICEKHGIKVPFKPDADQVGAGILWDGIVARQRERETERDRGSIVPDFIARNLENDVDTMRSTVLNRLSHAGAAGLVAAEVQSAIATVQRVIQHSFPKRTP